MISKEHFLLLNLSLAFYNTGTIWAHEVDIFRSWKLLDQKTFHIVQLTHWRKLPYWVFIPVGLALIGATLLLFYYPQKIPAWQFTVAFFLQLLSHLLTAIIWGPWQAKLSKDAEGPKSIYLDRILRTHWLRTFLITTYGLVLLFISLEMLS